jgi:hypothetical protein
MARKAGLGAGMSRPKTNNMIKIIKQHHLEHNPSIIKHHVHIFELSYLIFLALFECMLGRKFKFCYVNVPPNNLLKYWISNCEL